MDRLAPLLLLLGNRLLFSFVPLFVLLFGTTDEVLPGIGGYMLAVVIWTLPDLIMLSRHIRSATGAVFAQRGVLAAIRWGYLALGSGLVVCLLLKRLYPPTPWWAIGFVLFFTAVMVEQSQMRRYLRRVQVVDQT